MCFNFHAFAAGYERLARARLGLPEAEEDMFADSPKDKTTASLLDMEPGPSAAHTSTTTTTSKEDDSDFDMFGDDDDKTDVKRDSDANAVGSGSNPEQVSHDANETSGAESKLWYAADFYLCLLSNTNVTHFLCNF